ncbi:putative capsid protein [Cronartium ribicola totivirus 4]|uniref:Putative capsid protein n=1 Tax=Cronartium ribicola totivirus 4 TaxID=2687250 RepID=A0A6B9EQP5_9VIRU|nr:putative capsid protein [Cronartium ribicola totivirus 4]
MQNIINTQTVADSYNRGEVYFKTDLKLALASIHTRDTSDGVIEKKKTSLLGINPENYKNIKQEFDLGLEEYRMRNAVSCLSKGTVYGMKSEWVLGVRKHSHYGMNKAMVTSEGVPNPTAILKSLRELNVSMELKEARLNKLFNCSVVSSFYDNATALLIAILQQQYILEFAEKMETKTHTIVLKRSQLTVLPKEYDPDTNKLLVSIITKTDGGVGTTEYDVGHYNRYVYLSNWLRTTNESTIALNVDVWEMYNYDDGHSRSGKTYGDHFGFVNNMFIKPAQLGRLDHSTIKIKATNYVVPDTDSSMANFHFFAGFLNLTNFTNKDVNMLDKVLEGNNRSTPFLVDQDITLLKPNEEIKGYYTGNVTPIDVAVKSVDYAHLFNKVVKSHRLYEEAVAAKELLSYWICQPSSETLEAQWWTYVPRIMVYPQLGLHRAMFQCFLEGDAISLSATSMEDYTQGLEMQAASLVAKSMMYNTAWYWGEFLTRYNSRDSYDLHRKLCMPDDTSIRADIRATSMVSAVLGIGVRQTLFTGCSTFIPNSLEQHYGIRVKFGKIDISHIVDYGYTHNTNMVIFGKLVAPGGIAMITGLGGSLLDNTPYGSIFNIQPKTKKFIKGTWREAMHYKDLWARGVVCRFNGHDLDYLHPLQHGVHTIYAANDVSIATPPVPPNTDMEPQPYEIKGCFPRQCSFGSSFKDVDNCHLQFYWSRTQTYMLSGPDWRSYPAMAVTLDTVLPLRLVPIPLAATEYAATLVCTYDFNTSGFHVGLERAGAIPLPTTGPSALLDTSETIGENSDAPQPVDGT